jgi:hypothetical protein
MNSTVLQICVDVTALCDVDPGSVLTGNIGKADNK